MLGYSLHMLLVSTLLQSTEAVYNLAQDYSGDSFFEGWDFFTAADPTNGHVLYQSQSDATAQGLISIGSNSSTSNTGQVYIGVDNTNQAPSGRPSVRISTQQTFQHALVLADFAHQPGGACGVWPAFWMLGADWPTMGEIDIVEGVSTQATNQMTLHTDAGAVLDRTADFSGTLLTANCDVNAPNQPTNAGCGIVDNGDNSFGKDFNAIGGGVYATEWTSEFIKIWFFPRNNIPADIQSGTPNPDASWGVPNSLFQGAFSIDDHFKNLQIVMNTAFCGDWAGEVWSQTAACAALAPTCDEYVTNNPKAFDEAFWLVNSIKVFQDNGQPASPPLASSSASLSSTPSSTSAPSVFTPSSILTSTFTQSSIPQVSSSLPLPLTSPSSTPSPLAASTYMPLPAATTVTEIETFTVIVTATSTAQPQITDTDSIATQEPTGIPVDTHSGHYHTPGMIFGSPSATAGTQRKRNGGAVLPREMYF